MKTKSPRVNARDYRHLLAAPAATPAARAVAAYRKATGQAPAPSVEPRAGSPASMALALYRRLTASGKHEENS